MVGIVATLIFAAQMVDFPVGAGTSGHLMGGALAAVLVGPGTGLLCISVVLIVQAFLFADGGITALGTNIVLMGIVTIVVGWLVFRGLMLVLPGKRWAVATAAGVGAFLSVPAAAAVFVAALRRRRQRSGAPRRGARGDGGLAHAHRHRRSRDHRAHRRRRAGDRPDLVYGSRFERRPAQVPAKAVGA